MRDWLSHRAAATPDAEALVVAASGETLTYADLDARADALAGRLAGVGLVPGDHLAAVLPNRREYVTLVHAAMRLGVRLVPLSDRLTPAELRPRLDAADADAVVCAAGTEGAAVEAALGDVPTDGGGAGDEGGDGEGTNHSETDRPETDGGEGDGGATDVEGWGSADGFRPATIADDGAGAAETGRTTDREPTGGRVEAAGRGETDGRGGGAASIEVVSVDPPADDRVVGVDAAPDGTVPTVQWGQGDPLVLLFTSGTTGSPKLVTLTMGNVLASATASAFRLGVLPDDRYLATLSLHHTGGIMPLYRAALYGTSVVLREGFDAGGAADDVRRYDVTGVSLVPTMLRRMLDARGTLADSLRVVLLGGAPASEALIERCRNFSVPVHPTWGMTEAASQLATARPDEAFDRAGTVGRPLLWADLDVRDDDGETLPPGEVGELVVSGPTVTPGYYANPEANDAAFADDGAFRTGDAGRRDEDGYVYVLNRLDDRIVTGGENVDPGEVAAALREHPGVEDAAVVGLPDDEWGERVAALVVPVGRPGADADADGGDSAEDDDGDGDRGPGLSADDLEAFLRERLAGFKLPRTVAFADELPRTVSGTVERPRVRETLEAARERASGDEDDETRAGGGCGGEGENGGESESEPGKDGARDGRSDVDDRGDEPDGVGGPGADARE